MSRIGFALLLTLGLAVGSASAQSRDITIEALRAEKRVPLVIGNAAYPRDRLRNPVSDARAMASALRSLNFEVLAYENLNEKEMRRAVDEFGRKLRGSGVGIFYYSGHGVTAETISETPPWQLERDGVLTARTLITVGPPARGEVAAARRLIPKLRLKLGQGLRKVRARHAKTLPRGSFGVNRISITAVMRVPHADASLRALRTHP